MAHCPGLPWWASTRKVKPIWILLKQETVSGIGISWDICKSAPHSRQITCQYPTAQFFTGRKPFLPPNQQSKHWSIPVGIIVSYCNGRGFQPSSRCGPHRNSKLGWRTPRSKAHRLQPFVLLVGPEHVLLRLLTQTTWILLNARYFFV